MRAFVRRSVANVVFDLAAAWYLMILFGAVIGTMTGVTLGFGTAFLAVWLIATVAQVCTYHFVRTVDALNK